MAKLHGLIKFRRHDLDDKRRVLSVLNSELELLQAKRQAMLDTLAQEKELARHDIDAARQFPLYMDRVMQQVEAIDAQIQSKRNEIQAATLVVQEAFMEVKKLEITQENRDNQEKDRLAKIEANNLDEMGIEAFRRGRNDEGL